MRLLRFSLPVLIAMLLAPAAASAQTVEHTLSVVGRGQVEVRPDRGAFGVSVTRLSASANQARSRTNRQVKAIVAGLRGVGVTKDDLTTGGVSIRREKRRDGEDGPVRTRFRASVSLRVAVDGLALLGRAIDAASKRGATDIFGPELSFSPDRREAGRLDAEVDALGEARKRADAAAAATGQQVVGVQSIDLDPGQDSFNRFSLDSAAATGEQRRDTSTQIFAAKRKVTAQARVTYLIEPAG